MITKTYTFSNNAIKAEFTIKYPELTNFSARISDFTLRLFERSAQEINTEAAQNTPWTPMKDSYQFQSESSIFYTTVQLYNIDPIFRFIEHPTSPHFPNMTRVTHWARLRGLSPYLVAVLIAQRGTKGKYIMTEVFVRHLPNIEFNLRAGVENLLQNL